MNAIEHAIITPSSPVVLRARVEDENGNLLTVASTSTISVVITDMSTGIAASAITVTVATSVYDTLQLTNWSKDDIGFNVSIDLNGSNFPASDTIYQVIVEITPVGGYQLRKVWHLQTVSVI